MKRKTITEPAPAPETPEPVLTAEDVMAAALGRLRGSGGPLIDPGMHDLRDVARAAIREFPEGWTLRPTET